MVYSARCAILNTAFDRFGTAVNLKWALIALLSGLLIALLPPLLSVSLLTLIALLLIGFVQPLALLLVMFLVAPLKTLIETEAHISLDLGQWMLAVTLAAYLANRITRRQTLLFRGSIIYAPILMILLSASFSLFVALNPGATITELAKWVEVLGVAALVVSFCAEGQWGWIVAGLLAAGVSQALIGLYQFFGGSGAPHLWIMDYHFFRAFGTFGQPNPFGAFMGLTLPLAIGVLFGIAASAWNSSPMLRLQSPLKWTSFVQPGNLFSGIMLLLTIFILTAGLIASWSRGAWLGMGAALLVMLTFAPRRWWIGLGLTVSAVLLVFGLSTVGLLPSSLTTRLSDVTSELVGLQDVRGQVIDDARYAVLERLAHWQAAIGMANDHPLLGVGFGNYEDAYANYALLNWRIALGHAHNYYLNVLAETGIVGLIGYVAAWLLIFGFTIRLLGRTNGAARGLVLGLLGTWTYLAVHSLFDKLYVNNLFLHIGAMLGLIGGLHYLSLRGHYDSIRVPTRDADAYRDHPAH